MKQYFEGVGEVREFLVSVSKTRCSCGIEMREM